jgi:hypothetical protein
MQCIVPALIVFTKFDQLVSRVRIDDDREDIRNHEDSDVRAHAMFEDLCRSLFQKDPKDVPAVVFSGMYSFFCMRCTKDHSCSSFIFEEERGYGGLINDLTWTTQGLLKAGSHQSAGRYGKVRETGVDLLYPEEIYLDGPNLNLDETFTHADRRPQLEERYPDAPESSSSRAQPPVPPITPAVLGWSVAQRVNHDITIQASIEYVPSSPFSNIISLKPFFRVGRRRE